MNSNASIAHEFYKVQDYWKKADGQRNKKLVLWVAEYQDVEIIDHFMEIERSPLGTFEEIFFRFSTTFTTLKEFEKGLWEEFVSWFGEVQDEKYDIIGALKTDNYLLEDFTPNTSLEPNFKNLLSELKRFHQSFQVDDLDFIFYFSPANHSEGIGYWLDRLLLFEIPSYIRFAALDFLGQRCMDDFGKKSRTKVLEIFPKLDVLNATKNEMKKGIEAGNPHDPKSQYQKLVIELMECLGKKKESLVNKNAKKLLTLAQRINQASLKSSTLLIIAHAYFTIRKEKKSMEYTERAIDAANQLINTEFEPEAYPLWRSAMMIKAAILMGQQNEKEALRCYETMAIKATEKQDVFFVMEAYRLCATIEQKNRNWTAAFEYALLSLYAGSQLDSDTRKHSTFIYSANVAFKCSDEVVLSDKQRKIFHDSLEEWLGGNWKELIQSDVNLNREYLEFEKEIIQ